MKKITLIIILIVVDFSISAFSITSYDNNSRLDGVYYDPDHDCFALNITSGYMTLYSRTWVGDGLKASISVIDVCKISNENNNIYGISSIKPLSDRVFNNIEIVQYKESTTSPSTKESEDDNERDSVRVDFITPYVPGDSNDYIIIWGHDVVDDRYELDDNDNDNPIQSVIQIASHKFYTRKEINNDTVSVFIPQKTFSFTVGLEVQRTADYKGFVMNRRLLVYNDIIRVKDNYITISIPNYFRCHETEIKDEYFKVLYPGVIRWRGVTYYRFDSEYDFYNFYRE